jgi:hypothetical protein
VGSIALKGNDKEYENWFHAVHDLSIEVADG